MPIGRQEGDARVGCSLGIAELDGLSGQQHLAGGIQQTGQGPQELALAIAANAGNADDLSGSRVQIHVVEGRPGQVLDRELDAIRLDASALAREHVRHRAADDQPQHLLVRHLADRRRTADLAIAQHGGPISDLADLLKAVRDIDDGGAARGGGPNFRKQQLDEIRGQRCGRLVEHQHFRFDRQRFGELDELTLCDADFGHARPRTNGAADALELGGDPVHPACFAAAQVGRNGQQQILRHREIGQDRRMLMHDGKAEPLHLRDAEPLDLLAANLNAAGVRSHVTRRDPHQRRLARTVLAQQRVHFARESGERNVLDRDDAAEALPDIDQTQSDRRRVGFRQRLRHSFDRGHVHFLPRSLS